MPEQEPAWSNGVHGLRGRLVVRPGYVVDGTQMLAVDLELENVSDVANPIEVPDSWSVAYELLDPNGQPVEETRSPASVLTPAPFGLVIPYEGVLRFRVSVAGFACPPDQRAVVGVPSRCWVIRRDDRAEYSLAATFSATSAGRRTWHGELRLPPAPLPAP
jgi:hypothetical protein